MMLNYVELKYKHKEFCTCKESSDKVDVRNPTYDEGILAEYDAYCKECGAHLYNFCYGHYEIY